MSVHDFQGNIVSGIAISTSRGKKKECFTCWLKINSVAVYVGSAISILFRIISILGFSCLIMAVYNVNETIFDLNR